MSDTSRHPILKWGGISLLGLFAAFGLMIAFFWKSDLPWDEVKAKYTNEQSQFFNVAEGGKMHYRDQGNPSGPPMLLLHGSSSSLHTWEPWVKQLGTRYRVISVDLPGHGLTGDLPAQDYAYPAVARTVHELAAALNLRNLVLAGNSMGGRIALEYALLYPSEVKALVLVSSSGITRDPDDSSVGLFRFLGNPVSRRIVSGVLPRAGVARTLRGSVGKPDEFVTEEMVDRYYELILAPGNRAATRKRSGDAFRLGLDEKLGDVKAPALLIWGDQDKIVPPKYGWRLQKALPKAQLLIYPNVGHLAMEERPRASAREADRFVRRLDSSK